MFPRLPCSSLAGARRAAALRIGCVALGFFCVGLAGLRGAASGEAPTIPATWLARSPGPAEAALLDAGAVKHGWPAVARATRTAATELYLNRQIPAAAAWYNAARWAEIFGENETTYAKRWRDRMQLLGLGGGVAPEPGVNDAPISARLGSSFRQAMLADAGLSDAFFELLREEDYLPGVLSILDRLKTSDAAAFADYTSLALAVAVVYDCAPPAYWPHSQVSPGLLPRRLPDAVAAFAFLVSADRGGKSLHRLRKLDAQELRFAVDFAASFEDLRWAQANVRTSLGRLGETYSSINYKTARLVDGIFDWPGTDYSLPTIKKEGGICVDQAYYATQAGKARGVPTLLFCGAGLDGRHAWFGYLDTGRRWRLDAGRYEEQKFITGIAIDPQTWDEISDHELAFLTEGFRRQPGYLASRVHFGFANWLFEDGRKSEAAAAARAALAAERRNLDAWDLLLRITNEPGRPREELAREAARNLQAYPELQAGYLGLVADSLRKRGETAAAEQQERDIARRFQARRADLSLRQIAEQMARAIETLPVERQMQLYRGLLRQFGRGAGVGFYDEVARPLVMSLMKTGHFKEARVVLAMAAETLGANPGSQFGDEVRRLSQQIAAAEAARPQVPGGP